MLTAYTCKASAEPARFLLETPMPRVEIDITLSLARRFWSKVRKGNGCWEWIGAKTPLGYGRIKVSKNARNAHRIAYRLLIGEIPEGADIDHLCRNPACVNPQHLEAVSHRTNVLRGNGSPVQRNAYVTHCGNGHLFDLFNTYFYGHRRHCRVCNRLRRAGKL